MIGILIVAHGTLGDGLIHCACHVMGRTPEHLLSLEVTMHDDPSAVLPKAEALIRQLDQGDGVLILSDIYGATPCNIACRLIEPGRVEGVAGVNLPMLVRALTYRQSPLSRVVEKALSGGRDGVINISTEACNAVAGN